MYPIPHVPNQASFLQSVGYDLFIWQNVVGYVLVAVLKFNLTLGIVSRMLYRLTHNRIKAIF